MAMSRTRSTGSALKQHTRQFLRTQRHNGNNHKGHTENETEAYIKYRVHAIPIDQVKESGIANENKACT